MVKRVCVGGGVLIRGKACVCWGGGGVLICGKACVCWG